MPTGQVTHEKAWVEMVHRYLATGVGVLIATLALATWVQRKKGIPVQPRWPLFTLAWVCLQGAFGALTVTMKLFPAIVTLHLLGGMVLLTLLCIQAVAHRQAQRGSGAHAIAAGARGWLLGAYALLWVLHARSLAPLLPAPTTRCWPAPPSPPATGAGGR